jgi:UDP:flavonoid glycosyltransferase YjiC (YdhE family)
MNKICLIYQPAGIGDIFYSIGIARYYQKLGYRIIWPVTKEILDVCEQIPNIEFYD